MLVVLVLLFFAAVVAAAAAGVDVDVLFLVFVCYVDGDVLLSPSLVVYLTLLLPFTLNRELHPKYTKRHPESVLMQIFRLFLQQRDRYKLRAHELLACLL